MKDEEKTRAQLISEMRELRRHVGELEAAEAPCKQAEEKLMQVARDWQTTFDSIADPVSIQDEDYRLVRVNKAFAHLFGTEPEKLIGRTCYEVVHGTKEPWSKCPHKQAMVSKKPLTYEFFEPRLGVNLQVSASPVFDQKRKIRGTIHIIKNITERKRAEEELKRFQLMVESAHDAIFYKDLDSRYVIANDKTLEAFGLPREKVIGKNDLEIMPNKEEARQNIENDCTVFKTGKPKEITKHMTGAEGKEYWFEAVKVPQFDEDGNVIGLVGIARDITARKQAEEELCRREQKYRTLLENLPQKIFFKNRNSVYVSCNENYAQIFDLKADEVSGKTDYDLSPKQLAEAYIAEDRRVMESGKAEDMEEEYVRDGQRVFVHKVKTPVKDENGNVVGVLGVFWDITARKQAEQALRESEQKYRLHFENVNDVLFSLDRDLRVMSVSPSVERLLGYKPDELEGRQVPELKILGEESLKRALSNARRVLEGERLGPTEYQFISKDGSVGFGEVSSSPLLRDGKVAGIICVGRDITERKRLEREVLEIGEKERRRIGQDLHDSISQHLTGIAYLAGVLEKKLAARSLAEARDAAEIAGLVRQTISETRSLARGLSPVAVHSGGIVLALEELASGAEELFGIRCPFKCNGPVNVSDESVATQVYYIAQEAITNAVRHGKAKRVWVSLDAAEGNMTLKVRNDGVALPERPDEVNGMGLRIMEYRARMIGAALEIRLDGEKGAVVICSFRGKED